MATESGADTMTTTTSSKFSKTARQPRLHSRFVVRVSAAKMPSKCWGRYSHVGVIEVYGRYTAQLRETAGQTVRWYRGRLFAGTSDRCAAARAADEALDVVTRLERRYAAQLSAGYAQHLTEREDEI
jgi:hypothetical protein